MFRIWYSTQAIADWLIKHTNLRSQKLELRRLAESDASKPSEFYRVPGHLKNILYLDAPDIIVEKEGEPIVAVEISKEAGTGHNAFQRFARIAAAVENLVPAVYIYPEATFIRRQSSQRWDRINPNVFNALEHLMQIYGVPALLFYHPTYYANHSNAAPPTNSIKGLKNDTQFPSAPDANNNEMREFFEFINLIVSRSLRGKSKIPLINERIVMSRRSWMQSEYALKGGNARTWSPDTSTVVVQTQELLDFLKKFVPQDYVFGDLLTYRKETVIYQVDAKFRGDPYPGVLSALDYMKCRLGKTYEDRDKNLAISWGRIEHAENRLMQVISTHNTSINDYISALSSVRTSPQKCLLGITNFSDLRNSYLIPRYYMQARYGCMFTKVKHIRVFSYFADAILFQDGALWREG